MAFASRSHPPLAPALALLLGLGLVPACAPTVKVEAPKEPIRIDVNVKIEQEVRIKVEKDAEDLIEGNEELF